MPLRSLAGLAVVLILSGCASTPLKHYPDFPTRVDAAQQTRVVTDIVMDEDAKGRRDRVTLQVNREMGESLTETLVESLSARGYRVDRAYPAAVGLYLDAAQVRTLRLADSLDVDVDTLASPPFYVADEITADTAMVFVLDHLATMLLAEPGAAPGVPLATAGEPEALVLLTVRGRRVPVGKSIVQGVLSGLLTGGLVSVYQQSGAFVALDIVDASTGERIWSDRALQQGSASGPALRGMVRKLVQRMPDRTG